jgi:hypothetical protein
MELKEVIGRIRDHQPVLKEPERVTESIMKAISKESQRGKSGTLLFVQRLLAAASLALLLIFGSEQFVIVHKVSRLETQLSKAGPAPHYPDPFTLVSAGMITAPGTQRFFSAEKPRGPVFLRFIQKQLASNPLK